MTFKEYLKEQSNIVPNDKVYQMVQKIHRNYDDFIEGDLGDKLDVYDEFELKEIHIDDINLEEWDVDPDRVDDIKEKMNDDPKDYPIVVSHDMSIIDGIHRANAHHELGNNTIKAYVGVEKWVLKNT